MELYFLIGLTIIITFVILIIFYKLIKDIICFCKSADWKYIFNKFDIKKILGRSYFLNMTLIVLLIDFIVLSFYQFTFVFNIFTILCLIITIITFTRLIINFVLILFHSKFFSLILDFIERVIVATGVPRCGKTSSILFISVFVAKLQWVKLRREYWKLLHISIDKLSQKIVENKDETIRAYTYFKKHIKTHIPCLYSLIPVKIGKKQSYDLTKSMLLQKQSIPYCSVLVIDEISSMFDNQNNWVDPKATKLEFKDCTDLCRFIGQYTDSYLLLTEQNFNNSFKGIRDVAGLNINYTKKQKWVMKPLFLLAIYNFLFIFFDWYMIKLEILKLNTKDYLIAEKQCLKSSHWWFGLMNFLSNIIKNVGWRKYEYQSSSNNETEFKAEFKTGKFCLPSCLNCDYNDRVFKNKYKALNEPFKEPKNLEMYPSKDEILNWFEN